MVVDVQRNSITIKWLPPKEDGGSPLTGYLIEKREASSKVWSKVDKVADFITQYCVKNLEEKTEYHFRVIAINEVGQSEPLETSEATLAKHKYGMKLLNHKLNFKITYLFVIFNRYLSNHLCRI